MKRSFIMLFVFYSVGNATKGLCKQSKSLEMDVWFCCDNHEKINGTCVECSNGFESLDGYPCKPCENGKYGRKCGENCNCVAKQACNHIKGCIQGSSNISTAQVSTSFTSPVTTPMWLTILTRTNRKEIGESSITSTINSNITYGLRPTTTIKSSEKGLNSREIIVYSICAGAFSFVILVCTVCQRRYKQIYGNLKRYQTGNSRMRNIPEIPLQELPLEEIEGIYEVIDESNMMDHPENLQENNISLDDDNGSYVQPDGNGYITPYHSVDEDANTINLNDNKSESSSDPNHQSTMNRGSSSSNSDIQGRRSSYLNPYQPIVCSEDLHQYSFTYNLNDSSSSMSDSLTTESGYLNPYQPIVPDNDLHEYERIHVCSDELCSSLSDTDTKEIGDKFP